MTAVVFFDANGDPAAWLHRTFTLTPAGPGVAPVELADVSGLTNRWVAHYANRAGRGLRWRVVQVGAVAA